MTVSWEDVLSIEPTSSSTLELRVRDPNVLNLNFHRRLVSQFLRRSREADAVVLTRGLDVPSEAVEAVAMAWHSNHLLSGIAAEKDRLAADESEISQARLRPASDP